MAHLLGLLRACAPTRASTAPLQLLVRLQRIGNVDNVGPFLEGVKNRKERMFGFGHR